MASVKFFLIAICFCFQTAFGKGFVFIEPKVGIAPYQNFESKTESETLSNFFDYGMDIYFPIPSFERFEVGIGAEMRRIHSLLSNKKNVGLFFSLFKVPTLLDTKIILRMGFLQNTILKKTFYYAVGIEKSFHRFVFQVLFDDMQMRTTNASPHYRCVILRVGIKI